jgi:hypothetical protein
MRVVYQYGKSHISGGVRRSYRKRPCDVTSGSHVGHAQWYILYYYYSKKKAREPVAPEAALTMSNVTGSGPDRD